MDDFEGSWMLLKGFRVFWRVFKVLGGFFKVLGYFWGSRRVLKGSDAEMTTRRLFTTCFLLI